MTQIAVTINPAELWMYCTGPQAAIHYHLPYSSLYGRINRLKREQAAEWAAFRDYELEDGMEEAGDSNGIDYR